MSRAWSAVLMLCACGGSNPESEPVLPSLVVSTPDTVTAAAVHPEGAVWVITSGPNERGEVFELDLEAARLQANYPLDIDARDLVWFSGAWLIVGEADQRAAFRRVSSSGEILDGGEGFDGGYTCITATPARAVFAGSDAGNAFALSVESSGRFSEVWEDLNGVRVTDVALQGPAALVSAIQPDGTTALLRREDEESDLRAIVDFVVETITPTDDGRVFVAGASIPPRVRPSAAWLDAAFRVDDPTRFEGALDGTVVASQPLPDGRVVVATSLGDGPSRRSILSMDDAVDEVFAELGGQDARISDLEVIGGRIVVIGEVQGGVAVWEVDSDR